MKVIKSYWKSCLCFLLAFLCIISIIFMDRIVYGKLGGTTYHVVSDTTKATTGEGGGLGHLTNMHGYRIGIVDLDSWTDNTNGWYTVDGGVFSTNLNSGKVDYTSDNWCYFVVNQAWAKRTDGVHHNWFWGEGQLFDLADNPVADIDVGSITGVSNNDSLKDILDIIGVTDYSSEQNFIEDLGNKMSAMEHGSDAEIALKNAFGCTSDKWLFVIESLQAYGKGKSDGGGYENLIWYGRTTLETDSGSIGGLYPGSDRDRQPFKTGWVMGRNDLPEGVRERGILVEQSHDNIIVSSCTSVSSVAGYSLYGDPEGDGGAKKALANVAVTYTGAPNTSDAGSFNSAGTVGGYFDGSLKSWNGSGWSDSFNLNMSTTGSDYTLMFTGATQLKATSEVDVNSLISKGNNIGGLTLNWSTSEVTGDIHAGVTSKVASINGKTSTKEISDRMAISGVSLGEFWDCTANDHPTGTDAITNSVRATYTQAANWYSSNRAITKKGKFKKGETLGLGTEFIAKGAPVSSTHYIITVGDNGASVTSENLSYTTNSVGSVSTKDNAIALVVAKKVEGNTNSDYVKSGLNSSMTPSDVLNTLTSHLKDISSQTLDASSRNVTVGHDTSNNNEGYVIYEVVSDKNNIDVTGETTLEDWFLNKYTNNILETAYKQANSNNPFRFGINYSHIVGTEGAQYKTTDCGKNLLVSLGTNYKDYNNTYSLDKSGTEVSWDNSRQKIYYPASASSTFNGLDSVYKFPVTVNTLSYSGSRTIDYAFNFVRSATGDTRSISGISYASYNDIGDSTNMLNISNAFGIVPSRVVTTNVGKGQLSGTLSEQFVFSSVFTKTGTIYGLKEGVTAIHGGETYGYSEVKDNETGDKYNIPKVCSYIQYLTDTTSSKNTGLLFNISAVHSLTYNLNGYAYKYQTAQLSEGKNSLLGNSNVKGVATSANKPTGATKKNTNEYRFATVNRNSNVNLNFYPENYMVCKIGGTVFDTNPYQYVSVISEVKRQAESSSLYLIKVNTDIEDDSTITGSTYSDTMQGGSSSVTNSKVSIPAGSDITVLADTSNIKIDLYGYALDLIDKSKDSTMKTGASSSKSYSSVVKSGQNVYNAWNNSTDAHADKLKSNFTTWADNVMKLENFGADFVLDVNNNTKGANFGATIGKINHTSGAVEDGVYSISVMNGKVLESDVMEGDNVKVSSGAYKQLITQLAADYDCSYDEANALFKDSQIYTAILNAIESSTSSFNTSGKATGVAESWTSALGNGNNWYDERVITFVIRRYTNLGNTLSDITATDKLDYGLAPTGNSSGKENASAGVTYDAKWSLNLFFNSAKASELNNLIFENGNYYDPSSSTDITGANNAYTVLINKTPVKNADFLIPASSTSNFGF